MEIITNNEMSECKKIKNRVSRARFILDIIEERIKSLNQKEPQPDVIIIPISKEIIKMCKKHDTMGDKIILADRRFSINLTNEQIEGDYDFHNIIKIMGMKYFLPTQIILPNTLNLKRQIGVQDLAQRAWNLIVAMYYKAKGIPWKLTELDNQTCYAGISFYREIDETGKSSIGTSVAQIFLHTGESIVLRGDPFDWPLSKKQPYLDEEQSSKLLEKIIKRFKITHKIIPVRLVIHKSSTFEKDELNGFLSNKNIDKIDLITIRNSSIEWFREGTYAVPRGICIKTPLPDYFIFTLGYIPQLKTYPRPGIPIPINVIPYSLDSIDRLMCKEILSLTKLNWNNADFCDHKPITITASDILGDILSEKRAKKLPLILPHYRYYI